MKTAHDPQCDSVYSMENELCNFAYAPADLLYETTAQVVEMYELDKEPRVAIYPRHDHELFACLHPNGNIWLNSSRVGGCGANMLTLLHELAHVVNDEYGDTCEHHGRFWAGIYGYLLGKFNVLPPDAFAVMCRRWGIRRKPLESCSPRALLKGR